MSNYYRTGAVTSREKSKEGATADVGESFVAGISLFRTMTRASAGGAGGGLDRSARVDAGESTGKGGGGSVRAEEKELGVPERESVGRGGGGSMYRKLGGRSKERLSVDSLLFLLTLAGSTSEAVREREVFASVHKSTRLMRLLVLCARFGKEPSFGKLA